MSNSSMTEFHILIESGANVNYRRDSIRQQEVNEVFLYCLLTNSMYLKPLIFSGCDPNMCFEGGHGFFAECCYRFVIRELNKSLLPDFLRFILKFLIISRNVQMAVHALSLMLPTVDLSSILEYIGMYVFFLICKLEKLCLDEILKFIDMFNL